MYRHYESSEDVFVDREVQIEWMNEALKRCKKKSVVLHLKGIGGIGKSSLLNHWINTHEKTIRLDCYQYSDFFQRLNVLAKGAVLQGVKLQRFDILWQIRQRFVEGVEPVKEEGRAWAKEVVMAIPFIGSLASIGSAITAVGSKITPKLKGKYGAIGKWLQEQLGKNHIEKLLEILWKEPRRAEFLYLSAFLEDINTRDNPSSPLLFLFDHFEHVDDEKALWKYRKRKINVSELWTIFLSNLSCCVGVLASRKPAVKVKQIEVEETELLELDRDSCFEMLELRDVTDNEFSLEAIATGCLLGFGNEGFGDIHRCHIMPLTRPAECMHTDPAGKVKHLQCRLFRQQSQYRLGFLLLRLGIVEPPLEIVFVKIRLAISKHRLPDSFHSFPFHLHNTLFSCSVGRTTPTIGPA